MAKTKIKSVKRKTYSCHSWEGTGETRLATSGRWQGRPVDVQRCRYCGAECVGPTPKRGEEGSVCPVGPDGNKKAAAPLSAAP